MNAPTPTPTLLARDESFAKRAPKNPLDHQLQLLGVTPFSRKSVDEYKRWRAKKESSTLARLITGTPLGLPFCLGMLVLFLEGTFRLFPLIFEVLGQLLNLALTPSFAGHYVLLTGLALAQFLLTVTALSAFCVAMISLCDLKICEWKLLPIREYCAYATRERLQYPPQDIFELHRELRMRVPEAEFFVDILTEIPDPFLAVKLPEESDDKLRYIAYWDESRFKA